MPIGLLGLLLNKYTAILVILAVLYGTFKYQESQITALKTDIETSQTNNKVLKTNIAIMDATLSSQQKTLDKAKEDIAKISVIHSDMRKLETKMNIKLDKLNNKFIGKKKETDRLARLSVKKPGLIRKKINKGTNNVFRCAELYTGAPKTTEELQPNYKGNQECSELFQ